MKPSTFVRGGLLAMGGIRRLAFAGIGAALLWTILLIALA